MKNIFFCLLVISFCVASVFAQTPQQLHGWLPQIEGWTVSDKVEVFGPDNLFDRINGAAPLFLENNFREMTAMEYVNGESYITIQAYRHASPEDAFGMYASERAPDIEFLSIGGEAQGDDTNLYFFAGNMYVKMWGSGSGIDSVLLQQIAKGLADKIDPAASYPMLVRAFDTQDIIPFSVAYITSNYIGHTFLNNVYIANYNRNGQTFQAFIIDAKTTDNARKVLSDYFDFTKQPQDFKEGSLLITDRYNGDIPVIWNGRYILGIFSENGGEVTNAQEFLNDLSKKLN